MSGPEFKHEQLKPEDPAFKLSKLELSSDLKSKLDQSETLYKTMTDSVARQLASLLAEASIIAANVANVTTNTVSGDERYQQAA